MPIFADPLEPDDVLVGVEAGVELLVVVGLTLVVLAGAAEVVMTGSAAEVVMTGTATEADTTRDEVDDLGLQRPLEPRFFFFAMAS